MGEGMFEVSWKKIAIIEDDKGLNQGIALALENLGADVDFETVWGQGHVEAERTGDSTSNFIAWVKECLK